MQIAYSQNKYRRVILIFRNYHNFIDWHIFLSFIRFLNLFKLKQILCCCWFQSAWNYFFEYCYHNSIPLIKYIVSYETFSTTSTHYSFLLNVMTWLKWIKRWNNCEKKNLTQKCIKHLCRQLWFNLTFHSAGKSLADFRLFEQQQMQTINVENFLTWLIESLSPWMFQRHFIY